MFGLKGDFMNSTRLVNWLAKGSDPEEVFWFGKDTSNSDNTRKTLHRHAKSRDLAPCKLDYHMQPVVATYSAVGESAASVLSCSFLGGPSALKGEPCNLVLVAWKSWKLKRVSISTNDAEVQALVETEDSVYRTRLLWAEIHGAGQLETCRTM